MFASSITAPRLVAISSQNLREDRRAIKRWASHRNNNNKKNKRRKSKVRKKSRSWSLLENDEVGDADTSGGVASATAPESDDDDEEEESGGSSVHKFARPKVGGIVTTIDSRGTKVLFSLVSGETRTLEETCTAEDVEDAYAWAREEILVAYNANVSVLVIDTLGPEIVLLGGLDAAMKACLSDEEKAAKLVAVVDPTMMSELGDIYDLAFDEIEILDSFYDFLAWHDVTVSRRRRRRVDSNSSQGSLLSDSTASTNGADGISRERSYGSGPFYRILKFPFLAGIVACILFEVAAYVLVRWFVKLWELTARKDRSAWRDVQGATSYSSWRRAAAKLDMLRGNPSGGRCAKNITARRKHMRRLIDACKAARNEETTAALIVALRTACSIIRYEQDEPLLAPHLYSINHTGTNVGTRKYVDTVVEAIALIKDIKPDAVDQLRASYGNTALCLSGGAANCYYHLGLIKCLLERSMLPKHFSGASGGSMIGAVICSRTDDELRGFFASSNLCKKFNAIEGETIFGMLTRYLRTGAAFDPQVWNGKVRKLIHPEGQTFLEAYERTGRTLTITVFNGVTHSQHLNYKSAPHVLISSAVLASSALPIFLPAIELKRKDPVSGAIEPHTTLGRFWRDGSFKDELPFGALKEHFNVNWTIVSQVEPHLVPFFFENRGSPGEMVAHNQGRGWRGGFVSSYLERLLKLELIKWMSLVRDFKLMPNVFGNDVSSVFLGKWHGDCTVCAPLYFKDYLNLVSDPSTPSKINGYINGGEQATWRKIGMIADRWNIESALKRASDGTN